MPSVRIRLLVFSSLILLTAGQLAPPPSALPPRRVLQTPNFDGESFERFGERPSDDSSAAASASSSASSSQEENSSEMREQLKQLLGEQLANAFAPLSSTQLTHLPQRQPAIMAPTSGAAARALFANREENQEQEEEESPEEEEEEEEEAVAPQVQPQPQPQPQPLPEPQPVDQVDSGDLGGQDLQDIEDYNPWRDNFYDLNEDGSYVFGYALPHGVRRWERGYFPEDQHHKVVEGFYVQPRHIAHGLRYEIRCYRADSEGYHPMPVEFLRIPPNVRRDEHPQVSCFHGDDSRRSKK
ncbi:hypothetical protein KR018_005185 [Drosophila ironensis]|nr:hypothetical protein KR018_005185 [Drosophila ironensis]